MYKTAFLVYSFTEKKVQVQ